MAEVEDEIEQITESLERDSSSDEEDEELEVVELADVVEADVEDLVPDDGQDELERALEEGGEQKRTYHKLNPLPFFPSTHAGYRRRYYR